MIETFTYREVFSEEILRKFTFFEVGSCAKVAAATNPVAFADIVNVLERIEINPRLLLSPGGSRGPIVRIVDGMLHSLGWVEARVDIAKQVYFFPNHNDLVNAEREPNRYSDRLVSTTYSVGYSVDNVKHRLALDCEWNAKDGNLDRDFAAFRAWHRDGVIDAAFMITRVHEDTKLRADEEWEQYFVQRPHRRKKCNTKALNTSTTTNMEKALPRIKRGDLDTCPFLLIAINGNTISDERFDGVVYSWNTSTERFDLKDEETGELVGSYDYLTGVLHEYRSANLLDMF